MCVESFTTCSITPFSTSPDSHWERPILEWYPAPARRARCSWRHGSCFKGSVWTDTANLGSDREARLRNALAGIGIELSVGKLWSFWQHEGKRVLIGEIDPTSVAEVIRRLLN